jgi:hypothetical protein
MSKTCVQSDAYNVLALLKTVTEQAHRATHPQLDVSTYHLTVVIAI